MTGACSRRRCVQRQCRACYGAEHGTLLSSRTSTSRSACNQYAQAGVDATMWHTHSSYALSCRRSSRSNAGLSSSFLSCCPNLISPLMRNCASGRELHQADSSSWLITGPGLSDASGVAGDGEGDREHAVVDEDDMGLGSRNMRGKKCRTETPSSYTPLFADYVTR